MDGRERPETAPTFATPAGNISASDLLGRLAAEADLVAGLIIRIEAALSEVILQAGTLSPALLRGLQQIDVALQGVQDVSRVLTHAAGQPGPQFRADELDKLIRLRDMASRVLRPGTAVPQPAEAEDISWL